MNDDKRIDDRGKNGRWTRITRWLMVDILPVVGLLLLMAWGMRLLPASVATEVPAAVATISPAPASRN